MFTSLKMTYKNSNNSFQKKFFNLFKNSNKNFKSN
jgi:hypothetical protein